VLVSKIRALSYLDWMLSLVRRACFLNQEWIFLPGKRGWLHIDAAAPKAGGGAWRRERRERDAEREFEGPLELGSGAKFWSPLKTGAWIGALLERQKRASKLLKLDRGLHPSSAGDALRSPQT
jgi:hypothetical protein